jgi:hypothetical protein
VARVPGDRTEMYCASCEARTEYEYVEERRPPLLSTDQSSWLQNGDVLCVSCEDRTEFLYVSSLAESGHGSS